MAMLPMLLCSVALAGIFSVVVATESACHTGSESLVQLSAEHAQRSLVQLSAEHAQRAELDNAEVSRSRLHIADHTLAAFGYTSGQTPELDALFLDLDRAVKEGAPGEPLEGHTGRDQGLWKQTDEYDSWAKSATSHVVCETGFNAGHSALRFLAQSSARVFEFDLGQHKYAKVAAQFLDKRFPGRLTNIWGDSTVTLPQFYAEHKDLQCDILIVDGGHSYEVAMADLENMQKMAAPGHVVTIDDTPCSGGWCDGPTKAWKELVQLGCVNETEVVKMGDLRGFSVGHYIPCDRWA